MPTIRPFTTLFLIESLDGKISTGDNDTLDVDKDFPKIPGVAEGLHQYYEIEKTTDPFSLNTGRVMAKIGVNTKTTEPTKIGCSFVIIDNTHLTTAGVVYLAKWVKKLFLVTANKQHPVYTVAKEHANIEIIEFTTHTDLSKLLEILKTTHQVERLTIQSGGTLNAQWIREGLIDQVSIVIAPCLIGGEHTQSLIGGESLHTQADLQKIKALQLVSCDVLEHSYIHLLYTVL